MTDDAKDRSEPTWENQLWHARKLDVDELRRHASVSTDNRHRCEDCFCCAALTVLEEKEGRTRVQRTYWILRLKDGRYCGSPINTATVNPNLAACWPDKTEAETSAKAVVGATAVPFDPEADAWCAAGRPRD